MLICYALWAVWENSAPPNLTLLLEKNTQTPQPTPLHSTFFGAPQKILHKKWELVEPHRTSTFLLVWVGSKPETVKTGP